MKEVKDNFSVQSDGYRKFRPVYPNALYDEILSHVASYYSCWDCATGNGQIATVMAAKFKTVTASDISQAQLDKASSQDTISYVNCRAEQTPFADDAFDLITVGQAIHWFDFDAFNKEVLRVSKPNGILAVIGYGLMFSDEPFNESLMRFYDGTIGAYWDPERKHIDSHYESIPFPFEKIELKQEHSIDVNWSLLQLQGYLNTWSSVNRYITRHGSNPVDAFIAELWSTGIWKKDERKKVRFPLFVKMGRIVK